MARGLGRLLPDDARLVVDPFGERCATPRLQKWAHRVERSRIWRALAEPLLLTVQLRTRLIDDALVEFLKRGGTQVLLLGAGFDSRASRFHAELTAARARVFELDHPATQARKRELLAALASSAVPASGGPAAAAAAAGVVVGGGDGDVVTYLPWDFEQRALDALPGALADVGHDRARPTLTIWEGVSMYLSEPAVDASARAVASLSAPSSPFVFTYLDRAHVKKPGLLRRLAMGFIASGGEPVRFGFVPEQLAGWLAERELALEHDVAVADAGRAVLPERYAAQLVDRSQHIAFSVRR